MAAMAKLKHRALGVTHERLRMVILPVDIGLPNPARLSPREAAQSLRASSPTLRH